MKIGNVTLDNNIFLAPMAGITDIPFRLLCKEQGCGLTYTEMVSAKGIYYNDEKTKKLTAVDAAREKLRCRFLFRSGDYGKSDGTT